MLSSNYYTRYLISILLIVNVSTLLNDVKCILDKMLPTFTFYNRCLTYRDVFYLECIHI